MCHRCSRNCIGCEWPSVSPSGWQFLLTNVSTTWHRVTSPPSSNRRATLVTSSVYARRLRPSSMFLTPSVTIGGRAFSSTAARVLNSLPVAVQCSLQSHWTVFDAAWKLNCSSVLTTYKRLTAAWLTFTFRSFLLWPQPWSLLTVMLLWHSFLIIIIIIIIITLSADSLTVKLSYVHKKEKRT